MAVTNVDSGEEAARLENVSRVGFLGCWQLAPSLQAIGVVW